MISVKTHSTFDYVIGAVLILFPALCGIDHSDAQLAFRAMGIIITLYSLCSKYFLSLLKIIPVHIHVKLDVLMGVLTILAPFVFQYRSFITAAQFGLHVALGMTIIIFVGITRCRHEQSIAGPKITLDGSFHWGARDRRAY